TMLHFGTITDLRVEQVKGITYSLDALLGVDGHPGKPHSHVVDFPTRDEMEVVADQDFANVNGIEYSLTQLIGAPSSPSTPSTPTSAQYEDRKEFPTDPEAYQRQSLPQKYGERIDASVEPDRPLRETVEEELSVAKEIGVQSALQRARSAAGRVKPGNALFFTVIYLAPGDYHRFHSELFSVSPYMAKRLENLFVLNERVALLGRWRHGMFSMVPVGATNVGSIKINFDQALRTNIRGRSPPPGTYTEAVYSRASSVLGGQPLQPGEEMGGFCLGSTIVLVFEAPKTFQFAVHAGQKVKVGQKMGFVPHNKDQ
ncbi:hypothetical protein EWM64_g3463, partial [Hericium alpestre]